MTKVNAIARRSSLRASAVVFRFEVREPRVEHVVDRGRDEPHQLGEFRRDGVDPQHCRPGQGAEQDEVETQVHQPQHVPELAPGAEGSNAPRHPG